MGWLEKISQLDRRWIFLLMAIAVVVPLLLPLNLPFEVSAPVQNIYDKIEALPANSYIFISADYDPASEPELQPFLKAVLKHAFRKDLKVVIVSLWPNAPSLVINALDEVGVKEFGKVKNKDFCYLGYKAGAQLVILNLGEDLYKGASTDYDGTDTREIPLLKGIRNLNDFEVIVTISAGVPGTREYVQFVQARYGLDVCSACTAVSAPDFYPYYQAKQLFGLAGGMKGAAEYEKAIGVDGKATSGMVAQNFAHLLIILAIVLANIAYFVTSKEKS